MGQVKFGSGTVWVQKGIQGNRKGLDSLEAVLEEQANCQACGCSTCFGYWTNIDVETGDLTMMYISGGVLVIEPYEEGLANVKAAKITRDAE